jgi:hypothetical protein
MCTSIKRRGGGGGGGGVVPIAQGSHFCGVWERFPKEKLLKKTQKCQGKLICVPP